LHFPGDRRVLKNDGKTMHTTKQFKIGSDIDKMSANLADGVLTLTAPIKEKAWVPVQTVAILFKARRTRRHDGQEGTTDKKARSTYDVTTDVVSTEKSKT
jgi:hypothetical protein